MLSFKQYDLLMRHLLLDAVLLLGLLRWHQWFRISLPMQEMRVQPLGCEDTLEKEMAIHSSILAWEIPWTEESCGLHYLRPLCNSS